MLFLEASQIPQSYGCTDAHSKIVILGNMAAVKTAVQQLLAGDSAATVMAEMQKTYTTPESMKKHMSLVRSKIMDGGHYSNLFDTSSLQKYAETPEIAAFLSANLKEQVKIQREHKSNPTWTEEAEECLAKLQILPVNMNDFVLAKAESFKIKRRAATRLREKNANIINVPGGEALLAHLTSILDNASPTDSFAVLLCALAAVSGRRSCELLNGKSTFEPVANKPTLALFTGQLKTKSETPHPFVIPLCCTFTSFTRGLEALRAIQARDGGVAQFTNAEVTDKYRWVSVRAIPALAQLPNIKTLRSLYIMFVFDNLYDCPWSFNETACVCLGHRELTESLHYAGLKVRDCENIKYKFGKLEL
jgi:hypothetical protein